MYTAQGRRSAVYFGGSNVWKKGPLGSADFKLFFPYCQEVGGPKGGPFGPLFKVLISDGPGVLELKK